MIFQLRKSKYDTSILLYNREKLLRHDGCGFYTENRKIILNYHHGDGGIFMRRIKINRDWDFWKAGQEEARQSVQLPHDAMVLEERQPELFKGNMSGFFPGGKYMYEKNWLNK